MQNSYGFDFLRSEHTLDNEGVPKLQSSNSAVLSAVSAVDILGDSQHKIMAEHKPDLEKQFDILAFLQAHRTGFLAPSILYRATGINLEEPFNAKVAETLQRNPKVQTELVPDPENPSLMVTTYAYRAKYSNVRNRTSLLATINSQTSGISMRDLLDSYQNVEADLLQLIAAGDIIALVNTEDKDKILFPRGEAFRVELDGIVSLPTTCSNNNNNKPPTTTTTTSNGGGSQSNGFKPNAVVSDNTNAAPIYMVETDIDPRTQIRRGEAVQIGGQWFRVSSAVKDGVALSEQPSRAQAPLSVVSLQDLSKRNDADGYIRPFTNKILPLDRALSVQAQRNAGAQKAAREKLLKLLHGRSGTGGAGQLLGSLAHASNPVALAASLASRSVNSSNSSSGAAAAGGGGGGGSSMMNRKRPSAKISSNSSTSAPATATAATTSAAANANMKETLQQAFSDPSLCLFGHAVRHGTTKDVREMYLSTRSFIPESDADLHKLLLEHKLLDVGEQLRRPRLSKSGNVDNDGKPKKRRYYERKNQRMTNTHLEGTEIGAVLALAAEKQKQGNAVGDGGM